MKLAKTITLFFIAILCTSLIAQEPSAILNLESTTEGFLPPRMSTSQRDSISVPSEGMIIYNTSTQSLNCFNSNTNSWVALQMPNNSNTYTIGDLAFGGIVLWVDESGQHGLVAGERDLFSPGFPGDIIFWGRVLSLSNKSGIYAGKHNTTLNSVPFRRLYGGGVDSEYRYLYPYNYLLQFYLEGGYGDWYIPSQSELQLMFENLHLNGIGNFVNDLYGSSTMLDVSNFGPTVFNQDYYPAFEAWNLHFGDGTTNTNIAKEGPSMLLRPIRAF